MPMNRLSASHNPILQVAGLLVGVLVSVAAVLVGAVVLSLVIGLAVLAGLVFSVRVWWLRWRMQRAARTAHEATRGPRGEIVAVEYTVVKERTVGQRGVD